MTSLFSEPEDSDPEDDVKGDKNDGSESVRTTSRIDTMEILVDGLGTEANTEADLAEIKAKTMYRMVEDVSLGGGPRHKVLFLTNNQARLLTNTPGSIKRVLEAFEIPMPKLVIRFLQSSGGVDWVKCRKTCGRQVDFPFANGEKEALQAEQKLYHFMNEVLMPLAAETSALLLVNATVGSCMLTAALRQTLRLHQARFGNQLPFTVIALSSDFNHLYNNNDDSAKWLEFSKAVSGWRARHTKMTAFFTNLREQGGLSQPKYDMIPNFPNYILCDAINEAENTLDYVPFTNFSAGLVRHLMEVVPCIALKTGMSTLHDGDRASLGTVIASMESGCPTVVVNMRSWPSHVTLDAVKSVYEDFLTELDGKWDLQDCMAICLFRRALENSKMNLKEKLLPHGTPTRQRTFDSPIRKAKAIGMETSLLAPAKAMLQSELDDIVHWFSEIFTKGEMQFEDMKDNEQSRIVQQHRRALQTSALLRHTHLHVADAEHLDECRRLVRELVQLDRLPKVEDAEGLELLAEAWSEYDAKNYLAASYKFYSKFSYLGLLLLSVTAVLISILPEDALSFLEGTNTNTPVFFLSLIAAAAASFSALANPTQRWRVLRSNAVFLLSVIWQYRTRTKAFGIDASQKPQQVLCHRIRQWKEELSEGTSLLESTMEKVYPESVYKHLRQTDPDQALEEDQDDFYSPVPPAKYLTLRLMPAVAFYQDRIPSVGLRRRFVQLCLVVCSMASATLSFLNHASWIPLVASMYSSLAAWQEFAGLDQKLRRYTEAVQALKNIRSWWTSLTEVERASPECINRLVDAVEDTWNNRQDIFSFFEKALTFLAS